MEDLVSFRPDRELWKTVITPGDFNCVPYEESRCRITLREVRCTNSSGDCTIEPESRIFSPQFDGMVLIGDSDSFIDKDFELILQRMCSKEVCRFRMHYKDGDGVFVKEISGEVTLLEATEEQLISDWGWERLYEAALHHKEKGVSLVKEKRITDAFRRFHKGVQMITAIEPIDPESIADEKVEEIIMLKTKLYNNLAHCQLQYNEYEAALKLCHKALVYEPDNVKALYRRCVAYTGLEMYEQAWEDIKKALQLDPNDNAAQQRAKELEPKIKKINDEYKVVIKKMFG